MATREYQTSEALGVGITLGVEEQDCRFGVQLQTCVGYVARTPLSHLQQSRETGRSRFTGYYRRIPSRRIMIQAHRFDAGLIVNVHKGVEA